MLAAAAGAALTERQARAQLRPEQVLVVYDRRIAESLAVAEYYAGSAKVPGGEGNLPGVRPGVEVYNLETSGAPPPTFFGANIDRQMFIDRLRSPIRQALSVNNRWATVRCIVLTKGLPHRLMDSTNQFIGDQPGGTAAAWQAGNLTCASVDSELTLLWQNLEAQEAGGVGDSKADGAILNPYFRKTLPIDGWATRFIQSNKSFQAAGTTPATGPGMYWSALVPNFVTVPASVHTTPGDMYLVCRLDGHTVADVRAMIDRAQNLVYTVATATAVIDESGSNGVADSARNGEFDNQGVDEVCGGDDYEQTRDALVADGRYRRGPADSPPAVVYDAASGAANFCVGPLIPYNGEGRLVSTPVVLITSYGNNHQGTQPGQGVGSQPPAGSSYAQSFTLAPGAIFNSMESYNCRSFGGLGGYLGQQQAADFLASGGTFAVGDVFEPLAAHVPDSLMLARNFLLGNLSWAEAAWSSIPVLSWQTIVVGDPLARPARTSEDRDGDGKISVDDLYAFVAAPADLNHSGSVTSADRQFVDDAVRIGERAGMKGRQRP